MVVTNEKLAANRANAQHATGPRTPAGKRVTCRNAATHNAFCQHLLLDGEDAARLRALRRPWLASLNPQNAAEAYCRAQILFCESDVDAETPDEVPTACLCGGTGRSGDGLGPCQCGPDCTCKRNGDPSPQNIEEAMTMT